MADDNCSNADTKQPPDVLRTILTNTPQSKMVLCAICDLHSDPQNPRKHSRGQIRAIAKSIDSFGFNAPILADRDGKIIAGEGRFEAAKLLDLKHVPVIFLHHLSEQQARAYMLADNKLTDKSTFHDGMLALHLKEMSELVLDFDLDATGFEAAEIDFRIQSLEDSDSADKADEFEFAQGPPVSVLGDLWHLGDHRVLCADATATDVYTTLLQGQKAAGAFSDPPYNLEINGCVSGKGRTTHREFPMATGEMSEGDFTQFLTRILKLICEHTIPGAVLYTCMDWRHQYELLSAGRAAACDLINLCVWVKPNGGMGSFYRSRHELIHVFRNGKQQHLNNVQLGRHGRNKSNVWNFAGANSFPRKGKQRDTEIHPTVKPLLMVSDAILDSTKRNDIMLDPFLGSGVTVLAAERTNRRCYGIELDSLYVDTVVQRWQKMTGKKALNAKGETFDAVRLQRGAAP